LRTRGRAGGDFLALARALRDLARLVFDDALGRRVLAAARPAERADFLRDGFGALPSSMAA